MSLILKLKLADLKKNGSLKFHFLKCLLNECEKSIVYKQASLFIEVQKRVSARDGIEFPWVLFV